MIGYLYSGVLWLCDEAVVRLLQHGMFVYLLLCGIGISIGTEKATGIGNYLFLGRHFIIFDTTVIGVAFCIIYTGGNWWLGWGKRKMDEICGLRAVNTCGYVPYLGLSGRRHWWVYTCWNVLNESRVSYLASYV